MGKNPEIFDHFEKFVTFFATVGFFFHFACLFLQLRGVIIREKMLSHLVDDRLVSRQSLLSNRKTTFGCYFFVTK